LRLLVQYPHCLSSGEFLPDDLHHFYLACPMIDIISLLNAKSYLILGDEIEARGYENNAAT